MTWAETFALQGHVKRLLHLGPDNPETHREPMLLNMLTLEDMSPHCPQSFCLVFFFHVLPVYGTDAGNRVAVTHTLGQEPVSDLPGEHSGVLPLVLCYFVHYLRRSHLWLRASDHSRFYASCFIVSRIGIVGRIKYF